MKNAHRFNGFVTSLSLILFLSGCGARVTLHVEKAIPAAPVRPISLTLLAAPGVQLSAEELNALRVRLVDSLAWEGGLRVGASDTIKVVGTVTSAVASGNGSTSRTFSFHGRGGTLLGITIVNICLTLLTLGVYSFWAKVRVRTYLLSQSEVEHDRFAYHGTGRELFLGALKAGLVFGVPIALLQAAANLTRDPVAVAVASLVTPVVVLVFVPIAMVGARRYRLSRTSWRAIRFSFDGTVKEYLKIFVTGSLLTPLTPDERKALIEADTANWMKYRQVLDRESAHERLRARNSAVGQVKDKLRRFGNLFNLNR